MSAVDDRQSVQTVGSVLGMGLLITLGVLTVLSDIRKLLADIRNNYGPI